VKAFRLRRGRGRFPPAGKRRKRPAQRVSMRQASWKTRGGERGPKRFCSWLVGRVSRAFDGGLEFVQQGPLRNESVSAAASMRAAADGFALLSFTASSDAACTPALARAMREASCVWAYRSASLAAMRGSRRRTSVLREGLAESAQAKRCRGPGRRKRPIALADMVIPDKAMQARFRLKAA
jgi:hypothetical protein